MIEVCRTGKIGKQIRNIPADWHKIFLLNVSLKRDIFFLKRYGREFDIFRKIVGYDFTGMKKSECELRAMITDMKAYRNGLIIVRNIFLDLNVPLLDLYLIGRMLKKPSGGITSYPPGWNVREKRDRLFWQLVERGEIQMPASDYPTTREIDNELRKLLKELPE